MRGPGGGPHAGDLGGGPRGGTAMGEWPGGWVERGPPTLGRRGTRGMGAGEAPMAGDVGGFPRPVTGARAGKLVLPRPA
jgi:hypothetical protein